MKKTVFLSVILFVAFNYLQAQDNEMLTNKNFSFELNIGQSHSLERTAMSIFPNEMLQDNYSADIEFTAALNAGNGYVGLKFAQNAFTTTSIYNEDVHICFLALSAKEFKTIYNNFEAFFGASIGALFINNPYQISDLNGNVRRHGVGFDLSVGLDYSYKNFYVGIYGGISEQILGSKPKVDLPVETTNDYFLNFSTNIGLCFGIRL